jgi:hypothetical protein
MTLISTPAFAVESARLVSHYDIVNTVCSPATYYGDTPEQLAFSIGTWAIGVLPATQRSLSPSRLHDNRHYLSDVVFGAAVGSIAGRTVTVHGRDTWTMTPMTVPVGVALARRGASPVHSHRVNPGS